MLTLTFPIQTTKRNSICRSELRQLSRSFQISIFPNIQFKNLGISCTKPFSWEASSPYSIMRGAVVVEPIAAEDAPDLPVLESEQNVIDMKNHSISSHQPLKWSMWLLGPSVLLATGMVPTLWLSLSSVFLGPNVAGVLSLVGLDCIFNMGATLFLLMADACARPGERYSDSVISRVPLMYKIWNMSANLFGLVLPLLLLLASYGGSLQPHLPFISFTVLLGPYLLLLSIQMLTEMLTWHWKSPVWLVTPIVYEAYRVLQLLRGLQLASEISVPVWVVQCIRWLVSWWVFIIGVQLMRTAWFAGLPPPSQQ